MKKIINKPQIRQDRHLRWMMHAGIPIAIIAVGSLWLGRTIGSPALGMLFLVAMPAALALGLAYNIRFMILANRARKQDKQ
ncbi:hypothetical protein [Motiliproteus sediminis]|uniref:hypothetical protein n=1 Tax=Motiliproteus sediminis TaxID=1468178 RepID=UPI001AEF7283|nr:hypothetical protein [Motiliproteus sediminis]